MPNPNSATNRSLCHCSLSSGSDGLVKLWTIKTNECVKTLDAHQDKVWALHASAKDDKMVTGSADSNITVWEVRCHLEPSGPLTSFWGREFLLTALLPLPALLRTSPRWS